MYTGRLVYRWGIVDMDCANIYNALLTTELRQVELT